MKIVERTRDRACNYCRASEYREGYDHLKYYDIKGDENMNRMIISICSNCALELELLLVDIIAREVG